MADIHIEEFYKDIARILLQLHACFPRKAQVFVEDICGPDQPDEYGIHSVRHQSCFATMLWLTDEGFIRYDTTIRQEAIDQAVLTQKAFLRLNSLAKFEVYSSSTGDGSTFNFTALESIKNSSATIEPMTNVELIRQSIKTTTSTQLTRVLERILFAKL